MTKEVEEEQKLDSETSLEESQPQESEDDPSGSPSETSLPQAGPESEESQTLEFNHPDLRGKSPKEIEEYFELLKSTNREQNTMLNRLNEERPVERKEEPAQEADDGFDSIEFYDDPDKKLSLFQKRVEGAIERAISPFKENLRTSQAQGVRARLREEFDDFGVLEPVIDTLLTWQGVDPGMADEDTLRRLYFTAVGYATKKGISLKGEVEKVSPEQPTRTTQEVTPPNRRPSSSPPAEREKKNKLRELTENERRLARQWGMTPEEYLKEQDAESDEVVSPGFSKENW